jgi:hypothetical protein
MYMLYKERYGWEVYVNSHRIAIKNTLKEAKEDAQWFEDNYGWYYFEGEYKRKLIERRTYEKIIM